MVSSTILMIWKRSGIAHFIMNFVLIQQTSSSSHKSIIESKEKQKKIAEVILAMFNVLSFYIDIQIVLSFCSSWRTTVILLELRDRVTQIVPIYESYLLSRAIINLNLTGRNLTIRMTKLLIESKWVFNSCREINYSRHQRKVFIYFSWFWRKNKNEAPSSEIDRPYELPWASIKYNDSSWIIDIHMTRNFVQTKFWWNEVWWNRSDIVSSTTKFNFDVRNDLYSNIMFFVSSTMFSIIEKELKKNWFIFHHQRIESRLFHQKRESIKFKFLDQFFHHWAHYFKRPSQRINTQNQDHQLSSRGVNKTFFIIIKNNFLGS
jgi:hypothetical protein